MPIPQNPRPSMSILLKNSRNNGGELGKASPWTSVLRIRERREEGGGRIVLYYAQNTAS